MLGPERGSGTGVRTARVKLGQLWIIITMGRERGLGQLGIIIIMGRVRGLGQLGNSR